MFNINFSSSELQFPCHPRLENEAQRIKEELTLIGLREHFIVFSSGTTSSDLKGYAISKEALFANARAVNEHFKLTQDDVWGLSIPYFHIGGLSVLARAHLLGSRLADHGLWYPQKWHQKLQVEKVTVTTVVPTQVFDLVQNHLTPPSHLKFLIVGGDYLSFELEKKALELGWPIIRTFGMTEVCSQLASGIRTGDSKLTVLPIHQVKIDQEGRLSVKSKSLFTLEFRVKEKLHINYAKDLCDKEGYYRTQDLIQLHSNSMTHLGRRDDQIKVNGKLISFNSLKETLYQYALNHGLFGKVELILESDERMGKRPVVLHLSDSSPIPLNLFSPLKIESRKVSRFERTDLGKLKRN